MSTARSRRLLVIVIALVTAACAGASSDSDPAADPEPVPVEESASEPVPTPTPIPAESAASVADFDSIDAMLSNMGSSDIQATRECIMTAAAEEGLSAADLMDGTGAPVFIGALRCDDGIADQMLTSAEFLDTTGTDLTIEDVECVQRTSLDVFAALPLAETEDFFDTAEPPEDFLEAIMSACDVDRSEAMLIVS